MEIRSALVAIATPQFSILLQFYRQLLQQESAIFQRDRYAEFQLPGLTLALFVPKPDQAQAFELIGQSPMSLCLKVVDLAGTIARVQALGWIVGEVAIASHGQEADLHDPDGNRIILYQPQQPSSMLGPNS